MKIILIRHGEDPQGQRGGWSDSQLTQTGVAEVKLAAHKLKEHDFDLIISSDLNRAKMTAQIIGKECGKRIIYDPDLREINNGLLAGMDNSLAEILFPGTYYNTLDLNEKYPNGESPIDFFNRIRKVYQKLLTFQKDILVVTHSGVINAMFCLMNDLEFTNKKQEIIIDHAEFVVYYF